MSVQDEAKDTIATNKEKRKRVARPEAPAYEIGAYSDWKPAFMVHCIGHDGPHYTPAGNLVSAQFMAQVLARTGHWDIMVWPISYEQDVAWEEGDYGRSVHDPEAGN